jgi:hypothetical protein
MITETTMPARQELRPQACAAGSRSMLGSARFWLVLAVVVLVAGAAFNWSWLAAAGIAPVLLAVLPCVAMCALGWCAHKHVKNG